VLEQNYNTIEREGLAMVYELQKSRHYLLGQHFKIFTYHSGLRYLVNKTVFGGGEYVDGYFYFKSLILK
jgi:hypothetical protein